MEFTRLSSPSLKDLFVQQLQGMILSGALPVGAQLPPERVLAEQMHVSRTVVNSGLAELSDQGFLEVHPRQGTFVADYRRRGNLSTLIAIMQYKGGVLGREEIRSILEVRRALEHLAAKRAIRYASDEALDRLGKALAQIAAASSAEQAAECAFDFQHELALVGGNSIVPLIYHSFKPPVIALWVPSVIYTASRPWYATLRSSIRSSGTGIRTARPSGLTPIWNRPSAEASRSTSAADFRMRSLQSVRDCHADTDLPAGLVPLNDPRLAAFGQLRRLTSICKVFSLYNIEITWLYAVIFWPPGRY